MLCDTNWITVMLNADAILTFLLTELLRFSECVKIENVFSFHRGKEDQKEMTAKRSLKSTN